MSFSCHILRAWDTVTGKEFSLFGLETHDGCAEVEEITLDTRDELLPDHLKLVLGRNSIIVLLINWKGFDVEGNDD